MYQTLPGCPRHVASRHGASRQHPARQGTIGLVIALSCAALLGSACAPSESQTAVPPSAALTADVQRVALRALFLERERAASVVIFSDSLNEGPVFSERGETHVRVIATPPPLTQHRITLRELEQLFAEHVDGWKAFFRQYPRSAGLVEVGAVTADPDGRAASLLIARSCGEHCRMAWRVRVAISGSGTASAEGVVITPLPAAGNAP